MTAITTFFSHQPIFALFFTIAAGYLLGAVSVKGLSLGSGAVLFVGLAVGAAVPDLVLPGMLGKSGSAAVPVTASALPMAPSFSRLDDA